MQKDHPVSPVPSEGAKTALHTPGPWRALIVKSNNMDDGTTMVATTYHAGLAVDCASSGVTFAECAANARLISAAPDMLAEMRRFLPVLERLEDNILWSEMTGGLGIATINGYRAAIAKATQP